MKTKKRPTTKASAPETRKPAKVEKPWIKMKKIADKYLPDETEARKRDASIKKLIPAEKLTTEHNNLRLLCASIALKPYLEADLNSHEPWTTEIDEFLSAIDALQVISAEKPMLSVEEADKRLAAKLDSFPAVYMADEDKIPAEKPTAANQLFDPSKLSIDFDPYRSFESVDEAIAYCEKQPEPITAVMAIACANILLGEFGFASEVVWESETMAVCCPDVMPDNRD